MRFSASIRSRKWQRQRATAVVAPWQQEMKKKIVCETHAYDNKFRIAHSQFFCENGTYSFCVVFVVMAYHAACMHCAYRFEFRRSRFIIFSFCLDKRSGAQWLLLCCVVETIRSRAMKTTRSSVCLRCLLSSFSTFIFIVFIWCALQTINWTTNDLCASNNCLSLVGWARWRRVEKADARGT